MCILHAMLLHGIVPSVVYEVFSSSSEPGTVRPRYPGALPWELADLQYVDT